MKAIYRFKVFSLFLIAAYLLVACGGTLPTSKPTTNVPNPDANAVAFSGVVQAMNGTEWTVGGQNVVLDPQAVLDPNISVGDLVNVEANISVDGAVVARKVQSSETDDIAGVPPADSGSSPDVSVGQIPSANEQEVSGTVEAMTGDTITVDGVIYDLSNFTETKDTLAVGDLVKLHVNVNADGSFTVREIEKSGATLDEQSNSNGVDGSPMHDANDDHSKGNSTDDGPNHDSHDDHGGNGGNSGSGHD